MSVNVELKTPNQNNITWSLSLKANSRIPIVAERTYATLADAQTWVNDLADDATAYAGAIIAVTEDGKNNGIYYVASIAQAATETTEFVPGVLVAAGAGAGSEAVANYAAALAAATADNLGQILYVTNPTYKKGDGTTLNPDEADVDDESNKIVVYTAGPYIVTGSGTVAKLGTTSATGDIAGDVENLKGRVSTAEGEIDALQAAVGNAESGLVKDVADLQNLLDEESGRIDANAIAVEELRSAVAGGVHFKGVHSRLPELEIDQDGDILGRYEDSEGEEHSYTFKVGDVIIVAYYDEGDADDPIKEPTKEYILVHEGVGETEDSYKWVELGDVSVSDQKIADLENEFNEHVAGVTAMLEPYALAANVVANDTFTQHVTDADLRMDGIDGRLNGIDNTISAIPVKHVAIGDVLKLSEAGDLSVDMSDFVTKDGRKVLSTNDFTDDFQDKLSGIADGAQVNKIEVVKVNSLPLTVSTDKSVDIDLVNHLAGKVSINGQVLAETDDHDVLSATVDASDIYLGENIGDNDATETTVQSLLASVYNTANSKLGSICLVNDDATTANVLTLSKTNVANDTIAFKIAADSALKATTDGLDLVWTEL